MLVAINTWSNSNGRKFTAWNKELPRLAAKEPVQPWSSGKGRLPRMWWLLPRPTPICPWLTSLQSAALRSESDKKMGPCTLVLLATEIHGFPCETWRIAWVSCIKTSEQSCIENNLFVSCKFLTCHTESCRGCQLSRSCNNQGFGISSGSGTKWVFHMPWFQSLLFKSNDCHWLTNEVRLCSAVLRNNFRYGLIARALHALWTPRSRVSVKINTIDV